MLRRQEKHIFVRYMDNYCYAEIVLEHISTKKSIWAKPRKVTEMMDLIKKYKAIDFDFVAGSKSFLSSHFLLFAFENPPQGGNEAGEELRLDIKRAAKKRGLLSRGADPQPITRQMLEEPAIGWRTA